MMRDAERRHMLEVLEGLQRALESTNTVLQGMADRLDMPEAYMAGWLEGQRVVEQDLAEGGYPMSEN